MSPEELLCPPRLEPALRDQGLKVLIGGGIAPYQLVGDYYDPEQVMTFGDAGYVAGRDGIQEVFARLPEGWRPDLVIFAFPEFMVIPADLARCPVPVIALVSDWNLGLRTLSPCLGLFDAVLTDWGGVEVLRRLGHAHVHYWPLYSYDPASYADVGEGDRPVDVTFVGNLNPEVQRVRNRYFPLLASLADEFRVVVPANVHGRGYVEALARAKIVFNHSIRGELNLRCYEAPAAGALLFIEEGNREAPWLLKDREEAVYYRSDTLIPLLRHYLTHDDERRTIAEAGRRRVAESTYTHHASSLWSLLRSLELTPATRPPIAEPPLVSLARKAYTATESVRCQTGLALCQEAMVRDPASLSAATTVVALLVESAAAPEGQALLEQAEPLASQILERDDHRPLLWLTRGHAAQLNGDRPLARSCFQRAMEAVSRDPSEPACPNPYGTFAVELEAAYARAAGDQRAWEQGCAELVGWQACLRLAALSEAEAERIAWLERAISHRPDLAAGHFGLGHALLWTANWDKAIESFRRGLADHPLDFTAIAGLIAALTAAERRIEAADEYVAARRLFLTIAPLTELLGALDLAFERCSRHARYAEPWRLDLPDLPDETYLLAATGPWLDRLARFLDGRAGEAPGAILVASSGSVEQAANDLSAWLEAGGRSESELPDLVLLDADLDSADLLAAAGNVLTNPGDPWWLEGFKHGCRLIAC